jgi:cell division initiation protein
MDRIMPIDLERAKLRKRLGGYDPQAVENLLDMSAKSLEEAFVEIVALRNQVEQQQAVIEQFKGQEQTLRDALVLAQRTADETRSSAQRHAELILDEARQAAISERAGLQHQVADLKWQIDSLNTERRRIMDDLRATLNRFLREIDEPKEPLTLMHSETAVTEVLEVAETEEPAVAEA